MIERYLVVPHWTLSCPITIITGGLIEVHDFLAKVVHAWRTESAPYKGGLTDEQLLAKCWTERNFHQIASVYSINTAHYKFVEMEIGESCALTRIM